MEGLTRLVSESLARHRFDRPLDYRRLQWSRWFRCESHHSLLFVPSKPGVFAVAEEITHVEVAHVAPEAESRKPEADHPRRMLAVTQFFEDDDMAFVLDRMLSRQNPMSARLASGRYFVRFVVIDDPTQRRSICSALNQWMVSAAEKATGIGSHFATSLELTPATEYIPQPDDRQQSLFADTTDTHVGRTLLSANADTTSSHVATVASESCPEPGRRVPRSEASGSGMPLAPSPPTAPQLDSGAATNIHCPSPLPSGF
jgi:hypothetical protein